MSPTPIEYSGSDYRFIAASATDKRSPCPALNSLANHGYLPRHGTDIPFIHFLHAVRTVYNLSLPFALFLSVGGYLTCAKLSLRKAWWPISWTISLADLSERGWNKIAHEASLVHPSGVPSHAPDPALVKSLLNAARAAPNQGLDLRGITAVHVERVRSLQPPLKLEGLHATFAAGECALTWLFMGNSSTGVVELNTLSQWFGQERLPEGWDLRRPVKPVGLVLVLRTTSQVRSIEKEDGSSS